jgi:hypothetical protein
MSGAVASQPATSRFQRIFGHRFVGFAGTVASLLSVVLAIYFYIESRQTPLLTFMVNPAKAIVVKAGEASRLTIQYDDRRITTDITAAQVAVWNAGRLSIRSQQILDPVQISLGKGTRILEVTERKVSRPVVGMEVDRSRLSGGTIGLSWRILERNDGAVLQLIYEGGPSTPIQFGGTIEGQPSLRVEEQALKSPDTRQLGFIMLAISVLGLLFGLWRLVFRRDRTIEGFSFLARASLRPWALLVASTIYLVVACLLLYQSRQMGPPFGF